MLQVSITDGCTFLSWNKIHLLIVIWRHVYAVRSSVICTDILMLHFAMFTSTV